MWTTTKENRREINTFSHSSGDIEASVIETLLAPGAKVNASIESIGISPDCTK